MSLLVYDGRQDGEDWSGVYSIEDIDRHWSRDENMKTTILNYPLCCYSLRDYSHLFSPTQHVHLCRYRKPNWHSKA